MGPNASMYNTSMKNKGLNYWTELAITIKSLYNNLTWGLFTNKD